MTLAALRFPILERIPLFGDVAISPHGIGIAIGFLVGAMIMMARVDKRGIAHHYVPEIRDEVQRVLVLVAIGGILGARLFFVLTHADQYLTSVGGVIDAFKIWEGGLTFLGGVVGGVVLAVPVAIRRGYRAAMLLDSAATGLAIGLAIGRTGDILIGDHIGPAAGNFALGWQCTGNLWDRATNSFGNIAPLPYPAGQPPTAGCFDVPVHQTAFYDFGAALIVFGILLLLERRARWDGFFAAAFVFAYGALRFVSDFARQDRTWFGLTGSQWAILSAMAVVAVLIERRRPWKKEPWAWDLAFDHPWLTPPNEPTDEPETVGADGDDERQRPDL